MTKADKPITRCTYSSFRKREIVVTIHPTWIAFRLKGTRKIFQMDVEAGFCFAARKEAEKARAEQKGVKRMRGARS